MIMGAFHFDVFDYVSKAEAVNTYKHIFKIMVFRKKEKNC